MDNLQTVRDGRNAARYLGQLVATQTLTEADAKRLIAKMEKAFDAVLGPREQAPREPFAVITGGRP